MKFHRKKIYSWSKLHNTLTNVLYPKDEDEILKILRFAKANGKKFQLWDMDAVMEIYFILIMNTLL